MATFILIIIYIAFISLGLPDGMLGAAWPTMRSDFGMPVGHAGFVSFVISAGTILSSLLSVKLIRKFGTGKVTAISVLLTAIGLTGFALTPNFWWLFLFAIPLGIGAGAVDSGLNEYIAEHYKAIHMNMLHCFWGIGALTGPLIMSAFIKNVSSWRPGYGLVAIIQFVLVLILFFSLPTWKKLEISRKMEKEKNINHNLEDANQSNHKKRKSTLESLKIRGVKTVLICFMTYTAMELMLGLWGATYLTSIKGFAPSKAAAWVSLYYGGITLGRFLAAFLSLKFSNKQLIRLGSILTILAVIFLFVGHFLSKGSLFTLIGFILFGLGCAPIFPAMLHETPVRFGKENAPSVMGFQMAMAYTASTTLPPLFGVIASATTPALLPWVLAGFVIIFYIFSESCTRIFKN